MSRDKQQERPDPREVELVDNMRLDALEYIHGTAFEQIKDLLTKSKNPPDTMATIAYKAVRGVAEKNKATATIEMDMDMMMGVMTDTIDMVTEVAEAAGQVPPGTNVQQLKEDTLLKATVMHGEQVERTPENKAAAATDLRDYTADRGTDKAFNYVNQRAKAEGIDPQSMVRSGNELLYGSVNPVEDKLKDGVKRGLMDQAREAPPPGYADSMGEPPPPAEGLMGEEHLVPPQMPAELPTGEGLLPSDQTFPPVGNADEALLPPGQGRR